jgi:hypothetical protein
MQSTSQFGPATMTHSAFCASYLPSWFVMNRVVSMAYPIYMHLGPDYWFLRHPRWQKQKGEGRHAKRAMLFPHPTTYKRAKRASYNLPDDRCHEKSVIFRDFLRHQPSSFKDLSHICTPPQFFRLLRHPALPPTHAFPTTYDPQASEPSALPSNFASPTTHRAADRCLSYNLRPTSEPSERPTPFP